MKHFFCLVTAMILATSAMGQNAVIGREGNTYKSLPVKEIESVSHIENSEGKGIVAYKMLGGATYNFCTDTTSTVIHELLPNLNDYKPGDLYRILEEHRYTANEFIDEVYDPNSTLYSYFNSAAKANHALLAVGRDVKYMAYDIEYVSTDVDGAKILLSGRVLFPYSDSRLFPVRLTNIYLDNHYTMFANRQAPSESFENSQLAGMCTKGYLQVMPDFLGFGSSGNRTQLFVDSENMARHNIDCIKAALKLVKAKAIPLNKDYQIINAGGSQGAAVALGVHRYIEEKLSIADKAILPIKETRAMAGPYDLVLTLKEYCRWEKLVYSPVIPCLVQSMKIAHPTELEGYGVNDFFCEDFGNYRYARYKNRTIWELLDSKEYDSWDIRFALFERFGDGKTYSLFSPMMDKSMLNVDGTIDEGNPKFQALSKAFGYSNNAEGWAPISKVTLFHAEDDDIVPYANSAAAYDGMKKHNFNANVTHYKVNNTGLGHTAVCGIWYLSELMGIDINLLLTTLSILM